MSTITVGNDLAKNVFAVHGVDDDGKAVLVKPKVARDTLLELVANLPPCLIGMEACSGAHHWARRFRTHGHTVRLMAPRFIAPYRLSGKRGKAVAADAAAIREFGIVLPQKVANPRRRIGEHLEDLCPATPTGVSATCWPTPTSSTSASPNTTGPSPRSPGTMPAADA